MDNAKNQIDEKPPWRESRPVVYSSHLLPGSVLNRLREMRRFDLVAFRQVGNRPREFENAMIRAHAHLHLLHRRAQQVPACIINCAVLAYFGGPHARIH
jgi:hypothetical protein